MIRHRAVFRVGLVVRVLNAYVLGESGRPGWCY